MRGKTRILVIGPRALGEAVTEALPRCESVATEAPLSGLWKLGHEDFDGVIISMAVGQQALRAIRGLREVAPQTRIVASCPAALEPQARHALQAGADDYILEPLAPQDLEAALHIAPPPRYALQNGKLPPVQDILHLSEVLKNLGEGPQAAVERVAAMLRKTFDARGVVIQVDDIDATAGDCETVVLQEPVRRGDQIVGVVSLGPRRAGGYDSEDVARLADYAGLIEALVAQARTQARWQELASRDDLSGLHNRRYFDAALDKLLGRATRDRLRVTVILLDIDDFKTYNDRFGHDTGDALIREVSQLLTRCSRERDVVARYGGDEFGLIFWDAEEPRVPGSQHPSDPMILAERFCGVIRQHDFQCLGPNAPGPVTISGGLACFPWDGQTRAELIRAADIALLTAKRNGKNRIMIAGQREDAATDACEA